MIKIRPNDNPFDPIINTKTAKPENTAIGSKGLSSSSDEHFSVSKKLRRCLSGDETLVLSDIENVLSQSETMVDTLDANAEGDNDDLLSCDEDLLPKDTFQCSTLGEKQSLSLFLFLSEIRIVVPPWGKNNPYF